MSQTAIAQADWGGAASPFGVTWQKMMMWFFIVTDALLFAGLLVSYGVVRDRHRRLAAAERGLQPAVHRGDDVRPHQLVGHHGLRGAAADSNDGGWSPCVCGLTILGGFGFLGMQAYEWTHFIHEGGGITGNPWGSPTFSQFFFIITGFHGFHVLTGVTVLLIVAIPAGAREVLGGRVKTPASTGTSWTSSGSSSSPLFYLFRKLRRLAHVHRHSSPLPGLLDSLAVLLTSPCS